MSIRLQVKSVVDADVNAFKIDMSKRSQTYLNDMHRKAHK